MKGRKKQPIERSFTIARRSIVPRQVPPVARYSVIPSGRGYTTYRGRFMDDEK